MNADAHNSSPVHRNAGKLQRAAQRAERVQQKCLRSPGNSPCPDSDFRPQLACAARKKGQSVFSCWVRLLGDRMRSSSRGDTHRIPAPLTRAAAAWAHQLRHASKHASQGAHSQLPLVLFQNKMAPCTVTAVVQSVAHLLPHTVIVVVSQLNHCS